ncbi:hypothetical protein HYW55_00250 [Candidatus Gottesmanbacteria bacterium]|nr:hypothetical protein [Candidatus Gottesmanbacteria bacterium]
MPQTPQEWVAGVVVVGALIALLGVLLSQARAKLPTNESRRTWTRD